MNDDGRALLRHAVATLAYRARKVLRDAPEGFGDLRAAPAARRAGRILAHMGDLMDWGCHLADGEHVWNDSRPLPWDDEARRFYGAIEAFDDRLARDEPLVSTPERLFQGPVADALWHLGQLALLRRLAEAPIRGENYFRAEITVGRVGPDQADPRREFG
jgi:hypothetical protein